MLAATVCFSLYCLLSVAQRWLDHDVGHRHYRGDLLCGRDGWADSQGLQHSRWDAHLASLDSGRLELKHSLLVGALLVPCRPEG